jgi:hypothetical protein
VITEIPFPWFSPSTYGAIEPAGMVEGTSFTADGKGVRKTMIDKREDVSIS